jgi:hypothetical protein
MGLLGGTNAYAYVTNNPLRWSDIFGLTRRDVQEALELIRESQMDLNVPIDVQYADFPGDKDGETTYLDGEVILDDRFLGPLDNAEAAYMLETLMHETLHSNQSISDRVWDGFIDRDHFDIYQDAFRRTTQELIDELNRRRISNHCE